MDGNLSMVPVEELSWRPAAYAIVIHGDKILLLKQYNGYDLPGGGVDLGEFPEDAVIREVREEAGLNVANPKLIDVTSSFFKRSYAKEANCVQSLSMYYHCDYVSGEISADGHDEHEQHYAPEGCVWLPLADLKDVDIAASTDWRRYVRY